MKLLFGSNVDRIPIFIICFFLNDLDYHAKNGDATNPYCMLEKCNNFSLTHDAPLDQRN